MKCVGAKGMARDGCQGRVLGEIFLSRSPEKTGAAVVRGRTLGKTQFWGFQEKRVKSQQEYFRKKMHSKMPPGAGLTDLQNHKMDSTKRYFHIDAKRKGNALLGNQPKKTNQVDHDQLL